MAASAVAHCWKHVLSVAGHGTAERRHLRPPGEQMALLSFCMMSPSPLGGP